MLILDFSTIPKDAFTVAICSEIYNDFIADHQGIPEKIYIKAWQKFSLCNNGDMIWRGVPLEVK